MHPIDRHLANNHGIITRAEAIKLGMSERTISRRVASRAWIVLHKGVYRLAGAPAVWLGDARAAAKAAKGLISHRGAARTWRIDGYERASVELTVPVDRCPVLDDRIVIHRSTQMDLAGRTLKDRVPVTGCARTVLDVAAVAESSELNRIVDAVLRQRILRWHDLLGVLVKHSVRGRNGCGKLRSLLDARYGEQRPPDSAFNRMVAELLGAAGVGTPVFEHEVFDGARFVARVDLAFPADLVAIELDSREHHDNGLSFVDDRRRANRIVNCGWHLLKFTWDDYRDRPQNIVQDARDALRHVRTGFVKI